MVKKILIVDDEALILSGLSKCLANSNTVIKTVANGADALKEISLCPYDLCFLDVRLPDTNGLYLMKKIKRFSSETKVVIMTAHPLSDDLRKEVEDNAFNFISKPFDLSHIKAIAELALGKDGSRNESRASCDQEFKEGRLFLRKPLEKTIDYFAGVFEGGELKLLTLTGSVIDISDGGIGLKTGYNLKPGYMIRFSGETIPYEVGVVKWSMPAGDNSFRAGIEFMRRA
ncbi:MAG: response regulator [Nitrospiraceae bacterium]|nr:MAG: response regulator [Nitrospiraceae bacterium]